MHNPLSRYWLLLGVAALAIAGLFSLILVASRAPGAEAGLFANVFHQALVVHVDLSVLVWFLAAACMLWSMLASGSRSAFPYLEEAALICFALGTIAISSAPLDTHGVALMSNYIPVLMSPVFFIGLALIFCGTLLMLVRLFTAGTWSSQFSKPIAFAIFSGGIIALIAAMAFCWSYLQMPPEIDGQQYYEMLFWGGGHVLQFVHTQMVMACWMLLIVALAPSLRMNKMALIVALGVGLAAAFVTPLAYIKYEVYSAEHRDFFTKTMIMAGGIGPTLMALMILLPLLRARPKTALWTTLLMSLVLFLYGGFLGGLIQGQNVVIPAHYHGSIVGVTLAFMGVAYLFLPQFGYRDVTQWRLAFWQPIVYGGGQLLHISGLAWSGGYGVLRKTPGGLANVPIDGKIAMGVMGMGGMIAIIGGFMFVIIVWKAVRKRA